MANQVKSPEELAAEKAEKKKSGNTTVKNIVAEAVAKRVFASNKNIKEVFVTSDGVPFASESDAQNYAKGLKNNTITNIKR